MKNNLIILSLAISITILLWYSCKKDDDCLSCEPCEEHITKIDVRIINEMPDQEFRPCFNPNNSNEFVFIKERNRAFSLVKYEIAQSKETILLENIAAERLVWGKNNIIVFTNGLSTKIFMFNIETKELTLVGKDDFRYSEPQWKNDSIIAVIMTPMDAITPRAYYGEYNIYTKKEDTTRIDFGRFSINSNSELCYGVYPNLKYKQGNNISDLCAAPSLLFSIWHPNNDDVYYCNNPSLFKVNKHTKKVIQIKNGCSSKSYGGFSISPDGKKIITERKRVWNEESDPLPVPNHDASLWIMNIDGSDEHLINIK